MKNYYKLIFNNYAFKELEVAESLSIPIISKFAETEYFPLHLQSEPLQIF